MKKFFTYRTAVLVAWLTSFMGGVEAPQQARSAEFPVKSGLMVDLDCEPSVVVAGHPIALRVRLSNNTKQLAHITVDRTASHSMYHVSINYGNGKPVPKTVFGRKSSGKPVPSDQPGPFGHRRTGSLRTLALKPGTNVVEVIPLSRLFDISIAGKYRVNVTRSGVSLKDGKKAICSATVEIDVTEPPQVSTKPGDACHVLMAMLLKRARALTASVASKKATTSEKERDTKLLCACVDTLGELRAIEAAPFLASIISLKRSGMAAGDSCRLEDMPAAMALAKIGAPALDSLEGLLLKDDTRNLALDVMRKILGTRLLYLHLSDKESAQGVPAAIRKKCLAYLQREMSTEVKPGPSEKH